MLVAVTDHAVERFRQRIGGGSGELRPGRELVVITLWEREGGPGAPRVPRRFTDALDRDDRS